jgi:hypothetical protein
MISVGYLACYHVIPGRVFVFSRTEMVCPVIKPVFVADTAIEISKMATRDGCDTLSYYLRDMAFRATSRYMTTASGYCPNVSSTSLLERSSETVDHDYAPLTVLDRYICEYSFLIYFVSKRAWIESTSVTIN